jgi:hypothetical protein
MRRLANERQRLEAAKARLDTLDLYASPVRLQRVRVFVVPELFALPRLRRYHGYAFWRTILVRRSHPSDDLLTHELCHIWQAQHRPLAQLSAWFRYPYSKNPFEREARAAVAASRQQ